MTIASLSEDALISQMFMPIAGPGSLGLRDDAALLPVHAGSELVLTVDAIVAGVHFFHDDPPGTVARKALRVNLSDLAAKGAEPSGFLLTLSLPANTSLAWLAAFSEGLAADARAYGCPLLGGDTVRTPGPLTISITALGRVPAGYMVKRTGAKPGDILAVTGTIGDSALGLCLLLAERNLRQKSKAGVKQRDGGWRDILTPAEQTYLTQRYLLPEPRSAIALALREYASGAMDVSDGLIGDARKFLKASNVSGSIELEQLPLSDTVRAVVEVSPDLLLTAATGGDDYEVLCSIAPERFNAFQRLCESVDVGVTAIGHIVQGNAPVAVRLNEHEIVTQNDSYSHFLN